MKKCILFILLLTNTFLCCNIASQAQCHIDDWTALKALYESTDGDNWINNDGWDIVKQSNPPEDCDLEILKGVGLDENGRVDELKLYDNQLSGNIPLEIGSLSNLVGLWISNNELIGNIPSELCSLNNLMYLNLNSNGLSGNIPSEIGNLNNLISMDLSRNNLSGSIPKEIGNLISMVDLRLPYNELSGNLPAEIGNLVNLERLLLYRNQLTGSIPNEFGDLSNLTDIKMYDNQLSGNIPKELGNLSNLIELVLNDNELYGSIPPEIGNLYNLTDLDLKNNQLSGSIPPELGNLSNLAKLDLYNNQLNGGIPPEIGNLSSLMELSLWLNQLSGIIPAEIGNLSNLTDLSLSSNELSGSIPAEIGNLSKLTDLSLSNNKLSGNIPAEIGNLSNLKRLDLSANQLQGNIPPQLGNLNNLHSLWLRYNELSGTIPLELGNLSNLNYLNFERNQLSGSIPPELGNLSSLTDLWLRDNMLTGSIPTELGNLTALEDLYLENNQLNGNIPPELGNLSNLSVLWLSDNMLTGSIPAELGNLIALERLFLTNNQLSGIIPHELGNLSKLTGLWLRNNQFGGALPSELGNLDSLENLILANNQFNGSLPEEFGNLYKLTNLSLGNNNFNGSITAWIGNLTNLESLRLHSNKFEGYLPDEINNLTNLKYLQLGNNQFSGNIPELGNLSQLIYLSLNTNQFSGSIPTGLENLMNIEKIYLYDNHLSSLIPAFNQSLSTLNISNNNFSCSDISTHFLHNQQINDFQYLPQRFTPLDYDNIQSTVLDSLSFGQSFTSNLQLPFQLSEDFTYRWWRRTSSSGSSSSTFNQQPTLFIENLQPSNVGKYTLKISSENCLPDGSTFEMESDPIYIIVKGYDLYGQPVDYTQLMVEFEDQAAKDKLEQEVILDNGGIWMDKCDCNRELHLYDFPNDSSSIEQAYIAIDQKIKDSKIKSELDGGFNYKLNNIGLDAISSSNLPNTTLFGDDENGNEQKIAYTISLNSAQGNFTDDVNIYMLDSGLDQNNMANVNSFLYATAPVDLCYNISAPGYNFSTPFSNMTDILTPININYQDNVGHGTFGFNIIAEGLQQANNTKIVPLKVIEQATDGSLFDLLCAMYHAVDHNANVINISAGYRGEPSGIMENALYEAREKGIFVVAAAGNDGLNIDDETIVPQYPAYYASQYHKFYVENQFGSPQIDSVPYNNVISVANVNVENELNEKSNYGINSVTIAAPGEDIFSYEREGEKAVGNGTSFSAFLTTQVLAKEIARDNNRSIEQVWQDFENQYLVSNPNLNNKTSTGKQIDFSWQQKTNIEGCTDCTACNYWPYATIEDGSCTYCSEEGEELACANGDFEYCPPCVFGQGCTDIAACNYNPAAQVDNNSCFYAPCSVSQICTQTIHLNAGWNLISLDLSPQNPAIDSVFNSLQQGNLKFVTSHENGAIINEVGAPPILNTLKTIIDGAAYWVFVQNDDVLTITGTCIEENYRMPLTNGWNLIGYIPDNPVPPADYFNDLINNNSLEFVTGYDKGIMVYNPNGSDFLNTLEQLENSFGYWVKTNTASKTMQNQSNVFSFISGKSNLPIGEQVQVLNQQDEVIATIKVIEGNYLMTTPIYGDDLTTTFKEGVTIGEELRFNWNEQLANVSTIFKGDYGVEKLQLEFKTADLSLEQVDFKLHPNPTNGVVNISLNFEPSTASTLILYNLTGKIIKQEIFTGANTNVNLSEVAKGIYIIEIQNDDKQSMQKLIIE